MGVVPYGIADFDLLNPAVDFSAGFGDVALAVLPPFSADAAEWRRINRVGSVDTESDAYRNGQLAGILSTAGAARLVVPPAGPRAIAAEADLAAARGVSEVVKVGDYALTRTVAGKIAERPYLNSPLTLREIMAAGKPIPDPGGVAGALRWDVPGTFRGSAGTWELVVDPQSKTVLHWLFKSAP